MNEWSAEGCGGVGKGAKRVSGASERNAFGTNQ